nr:DUF5953 family protein [Cystobacter ferrugineus]
MEVARLGLTDAPLDLDNPAHLDALKRAYERFPEIGGRAGSVTPAPLAGRCRVPPVTLFTSGKHQGGLPESLRTRPGRARHARISAGRAFTASTKPEGCELVRHRPRWRSREGRSQGPGRTVLENG